MNTYVIDSYSDVATMFGDHSLVGPLANAWYGAHIAYLCNDGDKATVLSLKSKCLDTVAHCGNTATFDVSTARARALEDEIFPPGCGPYDRAAA